MTFHVADIASYQGGLTLAQLKAAGFTGVNFKVSHGLLLKAVHPDVALLADQARAEGWKLSSFHYLQESTPGDAQARFAYSQLVRYGLDRPGCVHVVDVEATDEPITATTWRDYCATMAALLGREIVTYTGRWWWMRYGVGWPASAFSPWLWAAPGAGYLDTYPGDDSPHWDAGYGQWPQLAAMQYRVAPVAGVRVSQTAVRSEDAWRAMGGAKVAINSVPASTALVEEFNALAPQRSKASDGTIGDTAHSQSASDHNPDETGNTGGQEDSDSLNEVHARDITAAGPWPPGWSMERCVQIILARCRAGAEKRFRNIIYYDRIWAASGSWVERSYSGANNHRKHAHFSFRYGSGSGASNPENITTPYGLLAEYAREQEKDMPLGDDMITLTKDTAAAIGKQAGEKISAAILLQYAVLRANAALNAVGALSARVGAGDAADAARDAALPGQVAEAIGAGDSAEEIAERLRAVLGDKSGPVGRLLAADQPVS